MNPQDDCQRRLQALMSYTDFLFERYRELTQLPGVLELHGYRIQEMNLEIKEAFDKVAAIK